MSNADRTGVRLGTDRPAGEHPLAGWHPGDLVLLGVVPVVLVLVYLLPPVLVDGWRLAIQDPTLAGALLSHLVHLNQEHLLANLLGYALLAPLTYVLCVAADRRTEFLVAFATIMVAFPPVLSALNLALVRPSISYGFSGIDMALLGLETLAVAWYVEARFDRPATDAYAPLGFFLVTGVIAAWAAPPSTLRLAAIGLALGAAVAYVGAAVSRADASVRFVPALLAVGRSELAVVGLLTALLYPLAAFPVDPAWSGTVVNLYVHVLGFCLGFVAPYATFALLDRRR